MTRRRVTTALILALALALALVACRKPRERVNTKQQQRQVETALLDAAPTPMIPVGATLDGKIRLIGVDLDKREVRPGQTFTLTWYWECLEEAPGGWQVFVHFEGPGQRTTHDHHPVGELHPIGRWKKGQIIKDVQKIPVADAFPEGTARIFAGVFDEEAWRERKQNVRMALTNAAEVKVPVQEDGRLEVASVRVTKGANAPAYTAHKVTSPILLDGRLDDLGWQGVAPTAPFVDPSGRALPANQRVDARLAWDDQYLYVGFVCPDSDIVSDRKGRDATLWEQDVVEVYLDPGADGKDYLELQIAPTGELFDALFSERRQPAWQEAAARLTMPSFVARVIAEGTVNQPGDRDTRWTVEARIAWTDIPGVSGPPAGQAWGLNLYRIAVGGESFMSAWTAVGGDFHNVADFGRMTFSPEPPRGARRMIAPPAPAPTEGAAPAPGAAPATE